LKKEEAVSFSLAGARAARWWQRTSHTLRVTGVLLAALAGGLPSAHGQAYPARPIRLIVPFPPGGGTDILARAIGQKLTESMGQQVVVDNRPGAGGNLGVELTVKAARDGYTILMVSASYAVNASIYKLGFDPMRDLSPITQVATVPFVLVAHPSLPANGVKDLIALARAKPGQLNYASSGTGSAPHLAGALFTLMTSTQIVHVPYKGGAPALNDVLGGQVQLLFSTVIQALPHVKSARLKSIAIAGLKRSPTLPQVPTIDESGVPGYDVTNWFGLLAPAGTPAPILARLNAEVVKHLQSPELTQRLAAEGAEAAGSTPDAFEQLIRKDIDKYTRIVKEARIRAE
jgi:tripartite-type tricarboxylate transporter receptor subunit TctC